MAMVAEEGRSIEEGEEGEEQLIEVKVVVAARWIEVKVEELAAYCLLTGGWNEHLVEAKVVAAVRWIEVMAGEVVACCLLTEGVVRCLLMGMVVHCLLKEVGEWAGKWMAEEEEQPMFLGVKAEEESRL